VIKAAGGSISGFYIKPGQKFQFTGAVFNTGDFKDLTVSEQMFIENAVVKYCETGCSDFKAEDFPQRYINVDKRCTKVTRQEDM